MATRKLGCPLCGANVSAAQLWAGREDCLDDELGVHCTHCPFCQGYLEMRPREDWLDIGYLCSGAQSRFDHALSLPYPGLRVLQEDDGWSVLLPQTAGT